MIWALLLGEKTVKMALGSMLQEEWGLSPKLESFYMIFFRQNSRIWLRNQ
jgi:hypothetical protein